MLRIGSLPLLGATLYITLFSYTANVYAADAPSTGTILQQQKQREQLQQLPRQVPEVEDDTEKSESDTQAAQTPTGAQIQIRSIRFSGADSLVTREPLEKVVGDAIGQNYGIDQIKLLATKVTNYLRSEGYMLAQAYLPQQDVSDGDLEITIVDGRLDGTPGNIIEIISESLRLEPQRIQKMAARRLSPDQSVKKEDLERVLLLVNDLPGISARATLKPGSKPGTTRIVTTVKEGKDVSGVAWVDNYGSRFSGRTTVNGQLNVNDPLKIGDRLSATGSFSEDQYSVGTNYSLPLGYDGIRLSGGMNLLGYKIGKELSSSKAEGQALTFNLGVSYPLIRSRMKNVYLSATYNNKELEDQVSDFTVSNRMVNNLQLGVSGDRIDRWQGGGFTYGNVNLTAGRFDLTSVDSDYQSDQLTAQVHGGYAVLDWSVARLQRLPGSFTLFGQFKGQFADGNLDSSEQLSLGGPTGVRAYPGGEASGDEGWLLTTEVRYDLPKAYSFGNIQLSGFVDYGHIKLNKDPWPNSVATATGKNSYSLAGAGFGVSLAKAGTYSAKLQMAMPVGDNDGRDTNDLDSDGLSQDVRAWVTASYQF